MKRYLFALLAVMTLSMTAVAQFSIGPRVGINVNSLKFSDPKANFTAENRAGFTGGVQAEFMIPMVNFGFDASVMYVHRSNDLTDNNTATTQKVNQDYIEIPVNLKYKIGLPVVGKVVSPYIFTGPTFAFRTSKEAISDALKNKKSDVAWNFGLGIQLFSHLQIGASYSLGLSKAISSTLGVDGQNQIPGKNKYWTVTAAWLF